jgi:DNA-binding GntR family transcriptional regulator
MKQNLVHRTLSSAIAEQLRQGILSGTHVAGSQLRQDALAVQYGVSRIPVREALFQLEAEGLVQIAPHKGAVVSTFSLAEVDDVFDLRVLLEPRLLRSSVALLTDTDYADIALLDDAFASAIAQQDVAHWGELNARFHQALYRHAAQPRTLAIVTQLLQSSERYTRVQMKRANPDKALPRAESEHRKLLQLCRGGLVDEACAHLVDHIEAVRKDLHRLLHPAPRGRRKNPA